MEAFKLDILAKLRFWNFRRRMKETDVKGLITRKEAWFLFEAAASINREGFCVEIGSFQGYSTLILAFASKIKKKNKVIAVDPHYGYPHHEKNNETVETYPKFVENLNRFKLMPYVDIKKMTSEQAAVVWEGLAIRFLWIDGDHEYEQVKIDYNLWEPCLVLDGIIAFHDAGPKNNLPGPRKLISEISQTKKFTPFQYVEGIAWAVKLKEVVAS